MTTETKRMRDALKALPASERLAKLVEYVVSGRKDENEIGFWGDLVREVAESNSPTVYDRIKNEIKDSDFPWAVMRMSSDAKELLKHVLADRDLILTPDDFHKAFVARDELVVQACLEAKVKPVADCIPSHWGRGECIRFKEYCVAAGFDVKQNSTAMWRCVTKNISKEAIEAALDLGLRPLTQDDIDTAVRMELLFGPSGMKRALELVPEMDPEKKLVFPKDV